MITHLVILSSSYSEGTRICIDVIGGASADDVVAKIIKECGKDVSLSLHLIQANSSDWDAVLVSNSFFADVKKIDNVDDFIKVIKKDRTLSALDVTKYIISAHKCTHLKLQKLLYLCYADYLCNHNKQLFVNERICALPHGPVISSICDRYAGSKDTIKENVDMPNNRYLFLPARSRIIFAEEGDVKINSIDKTLQNYALMSEKDLVNLTHTINSPWYVTRGKEDKWGIISDECIIKYHKNECC